jgi:hypothetical protein
MSFVVETTYDGGPVVKRDERWTFAEGDGQDLERAAQQFKELTGTNRPLSQIVEDLAVKGRLEYEDAESCCLVTAYEFVGAVV